ncbi:rna-directed dna polymerase from mobile element jockey-like [Pitangus sulphuratus]|nr:rna-directed dna polymerase from mobile element jockey-like [Pitangus sulphuratus]
MKMMYYTIHVTDLAHQGKKVDAIFWDFSKAFDIVSHRVLLDRMSITQLDKHTMQWVSNWLRGRAQRVTSDWRSVTSGVPQGSILSPVLFIIFIKDLDAGLEGILSKFEDDTELGGTVDSFKGREALERDLEKSEDWAITNHRKFNKGKCRILQLGLCNPGCAYSLGNEMLESSATERDLGSWGQW